MVRQAYEVSCWVLDLRVAIAAAQPSARQNSLPATQYALQQLDVLAEVPWVEEHVAYTRLCRCAHPLRTMGVIQELAHALAEGS